MLRVLSVHNGHKGEIITNSTRRGSEVMAAPNTPTDIFIKNCLLAIHINKGFPPRLDNTLMMSSGHNPRSHYLLKTIADQANVVLIMIYYN
jgi:hypothetical protein